MADVADLYTAIPAADNKFHLRLAPVDGTRHHIPGNFDGLALQAVLHRAVFVNRYVIRLALLKPDKTQPGQCRNDYHSPDNELHPRNHTEPLILSSFFEHNKIIKTKRSVYHPVKLNQHLTRII